MPRRTDAPARPLSVDEYVQQILSEAPPLTGQQRSRLAEIFHPIRPCIPAPPDGEQV